MEEEKDQIVVACHQPNFMPWPGFFYKALRADRFVLLDEVQCARGFTWVNRNRLKSDQGELWLTVPILKKGRGVQKISAVEIHNEGNWRHKHFQSIVQQYANAPYLSDHYAFLEGLYEHKYERLIDLNFAVLHYLNKALGIGQEFILQSALGIQGKGSGLLVKICTHLGATHYLAPLMSRKYLDEDLFAEHHVAISYYSFTSQVYPQLWGDFLSDLSSLDLLLTHGPKSLEIIQRCNNAH
jgi:hypothetical protein